MLDFEIRMSSLNKAFLIQLFYALESKKHPNGCVFIYVR